jgi:hypothetical protein
VIGITDLTARNAHPPRQPGEVDMLEQLAFALVAVALAAPFLVPLLWSQLGQSSQDMAAVVQDERPIGPVGRKIATVGAVIIAASAFVQTADAQPMQGIARTVPLAPIMDDYQR